MIKGANFLKGVLFLIFLNVWIYVYFITFDSQTISCKTDIEEKYEWSWELVEISEDELIEMMEDDEYHQYIPKTIDDYEIVSIDWNDDKINLVCYSWIDKNSFEIISWNYSKDKNGIYFWVETTLDKTNHVIYEIRNMLKWIDPVTFQDKWGWIITDKNVIYFTYITSGVLQYKKIKELDKNTFSFVDQKWWYIQDKNWFYHFYISHWNLELTKIDWVNISKFKNVWGYIYKDDKNIIYSWIVRKDVDLETFWYSDLYQIDKNHIYYDLRIVEWLIPDKTVAIAINDEDYLSDWELAYRFPAIWWWPRKVELDWRILRKYLEEYSKREEFTTCTFQ